MKRITLFFLYITVMKYIKTYETNSQFNHKYIILSYKKGDAKMISLFELSKSKFTARTHKTNNIGEYIITYKKGDSLYNFYQTYIIIPKEYNLLYETDDYNEALEKFDICIKTNQYNI